ncbi:hypothetical protein B0H14DRAFT_2637496 [Mycena olivaceomarginata]|nr:hypothetical protein B0H14DRAFT_2637496 [Mycena olivaceomarginata]
MINIVLPPSLAVGGWSLGISPSCILIGYPPSDSGLSFQRYLERISLTFLNHDPRAPNTNMPTSSQRVMTRIYSDSFVLYRARSFFGASSKQQSDLSAHAGIKLFKSIGHEAFDMVTGPCGRKNSGENRRDSLANVMMENQPNGNPTSRHSTSAVVPSTIQAPESWPKPVQRTSRASCTTGTPRNRPPRTKAALCLIRINYGRDLLPANKGGPGCCCGKATILPICSYASLNSVTAVWVTAGFTSL